MKTKTPKKAIKATFTVDLDWYEVQVHVQVNCTRKEHYDYIKKTTGNDSIELPHDLSAADGQYATYEQKASGAMLRFIWLRNYTGTLDQSAILLHEIIHLVHAVLDYVGVPIRIENDEVIAYGCGSLYKKITRALIAKVLYKQRHGKKKVQRVRKAARRSRKV